ncbi:hypothetical protein ABT297_04270 [Dactylosporangium sp. NPDC000555]|uniref:hypothetical protein n=1 Tax=Dactylosporangium sp. NPDC000555 TaxID=3154260 RepID=UPI003333F2A2
MHDKVPDFPDYFTAGRKQRQVSHDALLAPLGGIQLDATERHLIALLAEMPSGTVGAAVQLLKRCRAGAGHYTAALELRADQVDVGWLLLDASNEHDWHPITAVLECDDDHAEPFDPGTGPVPGYIAGRCGHRVVESEWRAGFRVCERCPDPGKTDCTILKSAAYPDGEAHCPAGWTVMVRIPAGEAA